MQCPQNRIMRTTVDIQDEILLQAKAVALAQRRRLSDLVNDALREALERNASSVREESPPYQAITFGEGGPCANVDFSDNGSVQEVLDDDARDTSNNQLDFSK